MARVTVNSILLEERLRIASIIESPEGLRNAKLARELALRTPLDPAAARALLAQAPADNPFIEAMSRETMNLGTLNPAGDALGGDPKAKRLAELEGALKPKAKA
jgi:hypothetical protein